MLIAFILLAILGGLSCVTTTPESRAEARARFARWNWLWITIIIVGWAVILYPWPPYQPRY
jgi:hypothetical protein